MSSSIVARRGALTALTVFAAAALFFIGLAQGSAQAADVTKGSATFNITAGKAGKVSAIAPAKVTKRFGKRGAKVTSAARNGKVGSNASARLAGGVRFTQGKRSVRVNGLSIAVYAKRAVVRGKLGGKTINVFNASGKSKIDSGAKTAKVAGARLSLTNNAAAKVRKALKLKKAPRGKIGNLSVNLKVTSDTPVDPCVENPNAEGCQPVDPCVENPDAEGCPLVDPYLAQCDVAATSKVAGNLPAPGALPTLVGPKGITGLTKFSWGIKTSLRSYIVSPATAGSIHALDGATATGSAPAYSSFEWTVKDGSYSDNGTPSDASDDRAVLNLGGTVLFCGTKHNFRFTIGDPTIVIDGEGSRVIADVDANLDGTWIPTQRIDLATLDLSEVTPQLLPTTSGAKWSNVPAMLTEVAGDAICGVEQPLCPYGNGVPAIDVMDPITVEAPAGPLADQYNSQCGVQASSRATSSWPAATGAPTLSGGFEVTSPDTIEWGFRSGFRFYVNISGGSLQALDGATRLPDAGPMNPGGFSFPVADGEYAANNPADTSDDQAVINGTGTALFCNSPHGFWMAFSNPSIIIDGENSRIEADLSSNESGDWYPVKRVNLASLDLTGITPFYNYSGTEVTWGDVPATLVPEVANLVTPEQKVLDPINVTLETEYDTGDGDAEAWDALASKVSTDHPFPLPDNTQGGCTNIPGWSGTSPTGGSTSLARTIDEYTALGGTSNLWYGNAGQPAAQPDLSAAKPVTGGGLDWGFLALLRSTLNSQGSYNLGGTATASHSYFGNGLGSTPRTAAGAGQMGNQVDRFFTWPAATTTSRLDQGGAGTADDRLVLKSNASVAFCQNANNQWYGTVINSPTVIIDGANSRIVADIATRYRYSWVRGKVDLASINLSGATYSVDNDAGTWQVTVAKSDGGSPAVNYVNVTPDGAKVLNMLGANFFANGLDGLTVRATFEPEA